MSPRIRGALLVVAGVGLVAALASELGAFFRVRLDYFDVPLAETPALVSRGREVFENRCIGCHRSIPLPQRVQGWDVRHAYDTLGKLQDLKRGVMPRFPGDDEERRALAAWLAAVGRGEARQ